MRYVFAPLVILYALQLGCDGSDSLTDFASSKSSGTVSAGPIGGATVKIYALNADGSQGGQLASTTTDANGQYTLNIPAQTGPVLMVASSGSYAEEASSAVVGLGNAQLRTVLPSLASNQSTGITPITEIAAQNALASINTNQSANLASVITNANSMVGTAMGVGNITAPPALPSQSAASASSTDAAKYAVALAAISQLAKNASAANGTTITSLDMMQALATSFTYNGSFSGSVGTTAVPVPNAAGTNVTLGSVLGGASAFGSAMASAAVTVTANLGPGFSNASLVPPPAFNAFPVASAGSANLNLPAPPASLPSTRPTSSGPPALGPIGSSNASSTSQVLAAVIADLAAQSDDSTGANVARLVPGRPSQLLMELLLPRASALACSATAGTAVKGSTCNAASMTVNFGANAANGCTNLAGNAAWSGSENLTFNSSATCQAANQNGLMALGANGSVTITSPAGRTRTKASGAYVQTDSNTVSPAGFSSQPSGGVSITCGASATNACAASRSINILGLHRAEFAGLAVKVYDHTLSTPAPYAISGIGSGKQITSGTLVLQHNLAKFVATTVIATPLTFTAGCCWPTGGSVTTTYSQGKSGSETLTFGSCGTAALVSNGGSSLVNFNHCQ